jgi:hypothetical protein
MIPSICSYTSVTCRDGRGHIACPAGDVSHHTHCDAVQEKPRDPHREPSGRCMIIPADIPVWADSRR